MAAARFVLFFIECAPRHRFDPKRLEVIKGDSFALNSFGLIRSSEAHYHGSAGGHGFKDLVLLFPVTVVQSGSRDGRACQLSVGLEGEDQTTGVLEGQ